MLISQLFIFLCLNYFYYLHIVNCTIWSRAVAYFYKSHLQSRVGKWATLICFSGLLDKYILISTVKYFCPENWCIVEVLLNIVTYDIQQAGGGVGVGAI